MKGHETTFTLGGRMCRIITVTFSRTGNTRREETSIMCEVETCEISSHIICLKDSGIKNNIEKTLHIRVFGSTYTQ